MTTVFNVLQINTITNSRLVNKTRSNLTSRFSLLANFASSPQYLPHPTRKINCSVVSKSALKADVSFSISPTLRPKKTHFYEQTILKILTLILLFIVSPLRAEDGLSTDAMDPYAQNETTTKAYTDGEIKWRVGYNALQNGDKKPNIQVTLSGKQSLCNGAIKLPPAWFVKGGTSTLRDKSSPDVLDEDVTYGEELIQSEIEPLGVEFDEDEDAEIVEVGAFTEEQLLALNADLESQSEIEYDSSELVNLDLCEETQTITLESNAWASEYTGAAFTLKKPLVPDFELGSYLTGEPFFINDKMYFPGRGERPLNSKLALYCLDLKTSDWCADFGSNRMMLSGSGGGIPIPNDLAAITPINDQVLLGNKILYASSKFVRNQSTRSPYYSRTTPDRRAITYGYLGASCFDINPAQPAFAGPCDGLQGRANFSTKAFKNIYYGKGGTAGSVKGPLLHNGKAYFIASEPAKLHCLDPDTGDECGAPYPVYLGGNGFILHRLSWSNSPHLLTSLAGNKIIYSSWRSRLTSYAARGRWPDIASGLDAITTRCWDLERQAFCWGNYVHTFTIDNPTTYKWANPGGTGWGMRNLNNQGLVSDIRFYHIRFNTDNEADGYCYLQHVKYSTYGWDIKIGRSSWTSRNYLKPRHIYGGCLNLETGQFFTQRDEANKMTYGLPDQLAMRMATTTNWINKRAATVISFPEDGYMLDPTIQNNQSHQTILIDGKEHMRTYYYTIHWQKPPDIYPGILHTPRANNRAIFCWDWTANDKCYKRNSLSDPKDYFGDNGIAVIPSEYIGFNRPPINPRTAYSRYQGLTLQKSTGCFWLHLSKLKKIVTMDSDGNFPCEPKSFSESRLIDPETLFCASGAPKGWNWNTIELYDFNIDNWENLSISLYSLFDGIELMSVDIKDDRSLFVSKTNRVAIDLKSNPLFSDALEGEKRVLLKLHGEASDIDAIFNNKLPTVILTIDSKKPMEFCINAQTGSGIQACGAAYIEAELESENGHTAFSETGVQVLPYTPDPESHTQPSMYVKQGADDGFGLMIRPYIYPVLKEGNDRAVQSVSTIQALFVETYKDENDEKKVSFIEDSNQNMRMDNDDNAVSYVTNEMTGMGAEIGDSSTIQHFNEVKPLWDAHQVLDSLSNDETQNQRPYTDPDAGRHILTWLDMDIDGPGDAPNDHNGKVDDGEVVPFMVDIANDNTRGLFKDIGGGQPMLSEDKVKAIIRFMRGDSRVLEGEETLSDEELENNPELSIVGFRDRRIQPPERFSDETFRLGGFRHSKPLIVGPPQVSNLSTRYNGDNEYVIKWADHNNLDKYHEFKNKYKNRRTMVYLGANDGMVHAFNSGFIDFDNQQVSTDGDGAEWALGQEVWAYVPRAVLPFIQDLTEPVFKSRFYIDGNPIAYDMRVFSDDSIHPGGWGTVLIVPMRMGGGYAEVELADGTLGNIQPVYIVLDITDPEQPPTLMAEITHPDLGFTTSEPTIVYEHRNNRAVPFLAFGSGPTNAAFAVSDQAAQVFLYNLRHHNLLPRGNTIEYFDIEGDLIPSFTGDMKAINLRSEFAGSLLNHETDETVLATDVVYFGTSIGSDVRQQGGRVMRLNLRQADSTLNNVETLLIPKHNTDDSDHPGGRPVVYAPTVSVSVEGKRDELWVYAATGRMLVDADESNIEQQYILGIIENTTFDASVSNNYPVNVGPTSVQMTKLVDVTDVVIDANGAIPESSRNIAGLSSGITNERQLAMRIINDEDGDEVDGWKRRFTLNSEGDGDNELVVQSGRSTGRVTIINNQFIVSEFVPPTLGSDDSCEPNGVQTFYRFNKDSGTSNTPELTSFNVFDAALNDADYLLWKNDLAIGAGSTTRLDPDEFYSLGGYGKRIRWREIERFGDTDYSRDRN